MMSEERIRITFRELLDRYGSRAEDWPEEKRQDMLRLCAEDPHARALLAEAEALDDLLRETAVPPAAPDLAERLLRHATLTGAEGARGAASIPSADPLIAANDNRPVVRWLAAGWLAASLLVGIWLGLSGRIIMPPSLLADPDVVADAGSGDGLAELLGIVSSVEDGGETL